MENVEDHCIFVQINHQVFMTATRRYILGIFLFWVFFPVGTMAQGMYTISGVVGDMESGEPIVGVNITIQGKRGIGTATDTLGKYSLRVPSGRHTLVFSCVGYEKKKEAIVADRDKLQDIWLQSSTHDLQEITVLGNSVEREVMNVQTGVERIDIKAINKLPVLMGERDILKSIQLLPGVKPAGEGSSGMFVRGGGPDQNSILLDQMPLYNTSHMMGFFSTFNSDIIQGATLYKGAMPAQYGERLASVFDIQTINGDTEAYHVYGGIGLISSRVTLDGPIRKGKSSFVISGRRTYADLMAKLSGVAEARGSSLYFYDLNLKMTSRLSERDRLTVSGYWGRDVVGLKDVLHSGFGNLAGSLHWNRNLNSSLLMTTSLIYNRYSTEIEQKIAGMEMKVSTEIGDYILKQDFYYIPSLKSIWRFGFNTTRHTVSPGKFNYEETVGTDRVLQRRYSWENGVYINHQFKLSDRVELLYGLRFSAFSVLGKGDFYQLDHHHQVVDTLSYAAGEHVKTYFNIEPRVSVVYRVDEASSFKSSYGRTTQNMHMLSNSATTGFMVRWASSSNSIKPQVADQVTGGYFRYFSEKRFEFSVEAYYKAMRNQIDFKDHARTFRKDAIETELLFGRGRAYGVEWLIRKHQGNLTGWVGYTLARSEKRIEGINEDRWYKATQDRTHDISVVGMYELNGKWSLSAAWVYYTGNAITYPSGKYMIDGQEVPYYTERNGYRAPAYHRLDLGATVLLKKTERYTSVLSLGLYNAYGRENPYMVEFRADKNDTSRMLTVQYSLFRFVPSISWDFRF